MIEIDGQLIPMEAEEDVTRAMLVKLKQKEKLLLKQREQMVRLMKQQAKNDELWADYVDNMFEKFDPVMKKMIAGLEQRFSFLDKYVGIKLRESDLDLFKKQIMNNIVVDVQDQINKLTIEAKLPKNLPRLKKDVLHQEREVELSDMTNQVDDLIDDIKVTPKQRQKQKKDNDLPSRLQQQAEDEEPELLEDQDYDNMIKEMRDKMMNDNGLSSNNDQQSSVAADKKKDNTNGLDKYTKEDGSIKGNRMGIAKELANDDDFMEQFTKDLFEGNVEFKPPADPSKAARHQARIEELKSK